VNANWQQGSLEGDTKVGRGFGPTTSSSKETRVEERKKKVGGNKQRTEPFLKRERMLLP